MRRVLVWTALRRAWGQESSHGAGMGVLRWSSTRLPRHKVEQQGTVTSASTAAQAVDLLLKNGPPPSSGFSLSPGHPPQRLAPQSQDTVGPQEPGSPAPKRGPHIPGRPAMAVMADLAKRADLTGCIALLREPGSQTPEFNVALRWLPVRKSLPVLNLMRERGILPDRYTALSMIHVLRNDRPRLDATMLELDALSSGEGGWGIDNTCPVTVEQPPSTVPRPSGDDQPADASTRLRGHWPGDEGLVPYFLWAGVHADAGDPEGVLRVMAFAQSRGELLSDRYLTLLIKSYGFSGRVDEARALLDEILGAGRDACDALLRALLNCFGRNGADGHVRDLLVCLDSAGVAPSADTYGAAVDALSECGDAEGARALLERMRHDPRGSAVRSAYAYTSLAKALAARGDVAGVRSLLDLQAADGLPPNVYGWNCLVQACRVAADADGLRAALHEMHAAGVAPNAVTHGTVLGALAATGDAKVALAYASSAEAAGARGDLYFQTTLVRLLAEAGRLVEARTVFSRLRRQHARLDAVAFMSLVDGALQHWDRDRPARQGELEQALALFEEMVSPRGSFPLRMRTAPTGEPMLDLHSHSPWTAQMATLRTLSDVVRRGERCALQIITGQGRRSPYSAAGGRGGPRKAGPIVRETVMRCLQRFTKVRRATWNPGLLIVPGEEMERLRRVQGGASAVYGPEALARWLVVPDKNIWRDNDLLSSGEGRDEETG